MSSKALDQPTRSFPVSTSAERAAGFLAASVFSLVYVVAPVWLLAALVSVFASGLTSLSTLLLWAPLLVSALLPDTGGSISPIVLCSWPVRQIPKYFRYEEFHEATDRELRATGKSYVVGAHPHGVFSFVGVCAAIASMNDAEGGFGPRLAQHVPTAAASVLKVFPLLKDVLGVFGVIPADGKTLARRLQKGSFVLYIGGMAELFRSSPRRETVFLQVPPC